MPEVYRAAALDEQSQTDSNGGTGSEPPVALPGTQSPQSLRTSEPITNRLTTKEPAVRVLEPLQHVGPQVQAAGNWSAIGAALMSFFGVIQGPLAVLASLLSICWLAIQIYSWVEKRRRK